MGRRGRERSLWRRKREQVLKERGRAGRVGTGAVESNDASDGLPRTCASPEPPRPPSHTVFRGLGDKQDVMRT